MDSAPAQIKVIDRRLVVRPAGNGTHEEELIEHELAVVEIAFGEGVGLFEVEGCDDVRIGD